MTHRRHSRTLNRCPFALESGPSGVGVQLSELRVRAACHRVGPRCVDKKGNERRDGSLSFRTRPGHQLIPSLKKGRVGLGRGRILDAFPGAIRFAVERLPARSKGQQLTNTLPGSRPGDNAALSVRPHRRPPFRVRLRASSRVGAAAPSALCSRPPGPGPIVAVTLSAQEGRHRDGPSGAPCRANPAIRSDTGLLIIVRRDRCRGQ
jgi:hypothetical protein